MSMSQEDLSHRASNGVQDPQQKIVELESNIADLQEQMKAVVTYLQDHEKRLARTEEDVKGVIRSRFWKAVVAIGGSYRKVVRRDGRR